MLCAIIARREGKNMDHGDRAALAAFISTICGGVAMGLIGGFFAGLLAGIAILAALICMAEDHEALKNH